MRDPLLLLLFLFAFLISSFSQSCPENVNVHSQDSLEALMAQYPDCEHIIGIVYLRNFTDLSPLSGVITIGGDLVVTNSYPGPHLVGLSSLSSVGNMKLENLTNLLSLSGIESLNTVDNDLIIREVHNLSNLNGLNGLTDVGGRTSIWNNAKLVSLEGLEKLEAVGGDLAIGYNDILGSVEEVSALKFIGEDLEISNNPAIEIITGFESLETITGTLYIQENFNLLAVYGFDVLTTVGPVSIGNPNGLAEIACLDHVVTMGSIIVDDDCEVLRLGSLTTVNDDFRIKSDNMHSLIGCDQLVNVGGSMVLKVAMSDLPDFPKLEQVGGMLLIDSRESLQVLDGFNQLTNIGIGQLGWGFDVYNHDQLTEISGFNQLEEVVGDFVISENDELSSITGFQNLFHVQGDFALSYNPQLEDCFVFCPFLVNRDESLNTFVWQNGAGMDSPCWKTETVLETCVDRPVRVQDVDLYFQQGKRKTPLEGALIELSDEGALVQSAITDEEGVGDIKYDELEEGIIYQLDVTFPENDDELLVRYRKSKTDLLNGLEIDFPLSLREKIDTTAAALDSLKMQFQIFGANTFVVELEGYDVNPFRDFLNDYAIIDEDHAEIIESMLRVTLGAHYIQEYYLSSTPFTAKFAKVSHDMFTNMATLASIYKSTNGLEDKLTEFIESEVQKGNITYHGIFAKATKNLIKSILNHGFMITKSTLLVPYMQSFGNTPEEQEFVKTMQRLIFFIENNILNKDTDLLDASFKELVYQWLTIILIQEYYISFATQDNVELVVLESMEMEGDFEDVFDETKTIFDKTQVTNEEAQFVGELYENSTSEIASVASILESLSVAITLGSAGSLTHIAAPMMKVADGFKGLAAILSGANFLNYGERIVFIPVELKDVVSDLSLNRNDQLLEAYPEGYLESLIIDLEVRFDSLETLVMQLEDALEEPTLSPVSATYQVLDQYYRTSFMPTLTTMKDIASHVANVSDSTLRQALYEYTSHIHQFEMQYMILQLQLTAIHMDSTETSYRDSTLVSIAEWKEMQNTLLGAFDEMYDAAGDQPFGAYVSVRSINIPDPTSSEQFEVQILLENVGPVTTPSFSISLQPNDITEVFKWVNGQEISGSYDSLELTLGEQTHLDFVVHVSHPDSAITLTIEIEGVEGNNQSFPVDFIFLDELVGTAEQLSTGKELVQLFPNPAKDEVTIKSQNDAKINEINVFSITGQSLMTTTDKVINISGWKSGIYIIEIQLKDQRLVHKLQVVK